jgi:hypothetical protein
MGKAIHLHSQLFALLFLSVRNVGDKGYRFRWNALAEYRCGESATEFVRFRVKADSGLVPDGLPSPLLVAIPTKASVP